MPNICSHQPIEVDRSKNDSPTGFAFPKTVLAMVDTDLWTELSLIATHEIVLCFVGASDGRSVGVAVGSCVRTLHWSPSRLYPEVIIIIIEYGVELPIPITIRRNTTDPLFLPVEG